jgi:hypothetical protein
MTVHVTVVSSPEKFDGCVVTPVTRRSDDSPVMMDEALPALLVSLSSPTWLCVSICTTM